MAAPADRAPPSRPARGGRRWSSWLGMVLVAGTALLMGWQHHRQHHELMAIRLASVAQLRQQELQSALAGRVALARFLATSPLWAELFMRPLLADPAAPGQPSLSGAQRLQQRAAAFGLANGYEAALVLDGQARLLAAGNGHGQALLAPLQAAARQALDSGQVQLTPLYRPGGDASPLRLDLVIPMLATGPPTQAAVVLRMDPAPLLAGLLADWPMPNTSAELALWQQQGPLLEAVAGFRLQPDAVGRLSLRWADAGIGVAQVVRGQRPAGQAFETDSYRGPRALSLVLPVAGSPWWLVAKVDRSEVLAQALPVMGWIAATALALALALGLLGRQQRQRQALDMARAQAQAQRQRLDALALLEAVAAHSTDAIYAKDLQGRYLFYNPEAARLSGLPDNQMLGQVDGDHFADDQAERLRANDLAVARSGSAQTFEETIDSVDGTITMLSTKAPLRDPQGQVVGVFGISRNIDTLVRARAELQAQRQSLEQQVQQRTAALSQANAALADAERFIRTVTDSLPGRVAYWDSSGRSRYANRSWYQHFGVTPEQVTGRTVLETLGPAHWALVEDHFKAAMAGQPQHFERSALADNGERTVSQVHFLPDLADGQVRGVVAMAFDISGLKQAEALAQHSRDAAQAASQAKSAFLANMSHEIRTPMNAIIGLAHLMRRDSRDALQRDRIDKLTAAADHLLRLISDVLDLSKIEAGKLTLDDAEFAVDALLARACEMVGQRARSKGLELILDADHLPERLCGDATRLSQALLNLLSNAVKFTHSGWVRLRAERLRELDGRLLVRFEVRDTGVGIAPEQQAQLFSAFEQADSSTSRRYGGTGLGLALTRKLAELMGGEAGLSSAPGQGSSFWFTAWLGLAAPAAADDTVGSHQALHHLHALLVDDLAEARAALRDRLEWLGLQVDLAASGPAAVEQVQRRLAAGQAYDVLLIDWRMAPMDGIATLRRLRALAGSGLPPALLITAYDNPQMRAQALEAGFGQVLVKPISASALHDSLLRLVQRNGAPLQAGQASTGQAEALLRARPQPATVLLVDDNPVNREVAADLLGSVGLRVIEAEDGERAVALATAEPGPDLVLMDVQMPVMDGLTATRAIRALRGASLPVLAMTANAMGEDRRACLDAGMNDHLAKPVDPERLYTLLLQWLPAPTLPDATPPPATPAAGSAAADAPPLAATGLREALMACPGMDVAGLYQRLSGREALIARVLWGFVRQYEQGVAALRAPLRSARALAAAAHSLRGAVATVGATDLQQLASLLETGARALADSMGAGAGAEHPDGAGAETMSADAAAAPALAALAAQAAALDQRLREQVRRLADLLRQAGTAPD